MEADAAPADHPPHPLAEFWSHFRQNRGAVAGLGIIAAFALVALLAPLVSGDPSLIHQGALRIPPLWSGDGTTAFPLGTDDVGRDILARLVHGAKVSMGVGLSVVVLSLSAGTVLGLVAGFHGGLADKAVMRFTDILMAFPSILLAIVVVSILGPGIGNAVIAVAVVAVPQFTRIVRASALVEKQKKYVHASTLFGASAARIMVLEILPNCMAPLTVQATLGFSNGILNVAALGFLGLGAQPPLPEWGIMLADSRPFIESSPWMVTLPGLCILVTILGFNLFGDGLRDALDPRLKR